MHGHIRCTPKRRTEAIPTFFWAQCQRRRKLRRPCDHRKSGAWWAWTLTWRRE
ncbi:hypothetical protein ES319_A10G214800v1 [Gossypium barbadense]|uniref:Uncharacterized protein n=2 Tax=Gossypium TaxID=3633 RepID=A0A5J5U7W9_GOSBA|nr:hypothetical protein ES319_A10G214800v1 [Gossypium barbadense]TYH00023.1 hypothetical protein ES288_A10G241900v1 [Gossypium darwinii]